MKRILPLIIAMLITLTGCTTGPEIGENPNLTSKDWALMLDSADGTSIQVNYDVADPSMKKWIDNYIPKLVKTRSNVTVNPIEKSLDMYLKRLQKEYAEEDDTGRIDMIIFDDASFLALKESNLLYGPFRGKIPNAYDLQDEDDYEVNYLQGQKLEGNAVLLGRQQLIMVYDEDLSEYPPSSPNELLEMLAENKWRFTYVDPSHPLGRAFVESVLVSSTDYEDLYRDGLTKSEIKAMVEPGLEFFRKLKPYMYGTVNSLPADQDAIDDLFFKGNIHFAMTFDLNHASTLAKRELYPFGARAFVFDTGTTGNSIYAVIPFNSTNKTGSLIALNNMLSSEAQAYKYNPSFWGNLPGIRTSKVREEDKTFFKKISLKRADMKEDMLLEHRLPTVPEELSDILIEIWEEEIKEAK